jgi:xanthine dehydrogenase YagS FAD-binding subunit
MESFVYKNATTIEEAVSVLQAGEAAILAGGTDLLNLLKTGALSQPPKTLVNIKNIPGLSFIREEPAGGLALGPATTLSAIASSPLIREKCSALSKAAGSAASPPLREMGTLGGNLCQEIRCWYFRRSRQTGVDFQCLRKGGRTCFAVRGDNRYHSVFGGAEGCMAVNPSDSAPVLLALAAQIKTTTRVLDIGEFFKGGLEPDEIILEIRIPPASDIRQDFAKFAIRPTIDFAVVNLALAVTLADGKVVDAKIALNAVAPAPRRAIKAEDVLTNNLLNEETITFAAEALAEEAKPLSGNSYKVQIAKALLKQTLLQLRDNRP